MVQRPAADSVAGGSTLLVKLDLNGQAGQDRAGDVDDNGVPGLESGALGNQLEQLIHNRADAQRWRGRVQVAGSLERSADVLLMGSCVEGAEQHHGRCLIRTERSSNDSGRGSARILKRRK